MNAYSCSFPVPKYNIKFSHECIGYWQCFKTSEINLKCRSWYDSEEKLTYGEADILGHNTMGTQSYGFRRAWDIEVCKDYLRKWKKLVEGQNHVCLYGFPVGDLSELDNKNQKPIHGWVWDKLKTKVGCNSYFDGDCDMMNVISENKIHPDFLIFDSNTKDTSM